jgi:hypothetical protein
MALILLFACLVWAAVAGAQPVAGTACATHTDVATTVSYPCTIAAGSNRAVIVAIVTEVGRTVSNLTFAGSALTSVGSVTGANNMHQMAMYRQVNPPTGSQNLAYDFSPEGYTFGLTAPFTNVHQTTPVDTAATNTSVGPVSTTTVTVTSATGDLVVDSVFWGFGDCGGPPFVPGAGQTALVIDQTPGVASGMSTKAGAASAEMTWTCYIPDEYVAIGVSINPVPAAGAASTRRRFQ